MVECHQGQLGRGSLPREILVWARKSGFEIDGYRDSFFSTSISSAIGLSVLNFAALGAESQSARDPQYGRVEIGYHLADCAQGADGHPDESATENP